MSALGTVLVISRVELVRFLRERSNFFFVFILPLLLIFFIGLQFGSSPTPKLGVVTEGETPSPVLAEVLTHSAGLEVVAVDDREQLVTAVARGRLSAGVIIPAGASQASERGEPFEIGFVGRPDGTAASLQALVDTALAEHAAINGAARAASQVTGAPFAESAELARMIRNQQPEIVVSTESVGGDELTQEFMAMGQFELGASSQLFLFIFLTSLAGSAALIQTRQLGVATRMMSTAIAMPTLLAGLAGGRFAVAVFQALYIVLVTAIGFNVNWGDPLATGLLILLFCLVSTGAAMVAGSLFRNDSQASSAGVGIGLILAALGGSMFPLDFIPDAMRPIAMATPHGWANTAIAEIVRRDAGVGDIVMELAVLAVFAAVLLGTATVLLRRALTR